MASLAAGMDYVDLDFLDHPGVIATGVLRSDRGVALVDPGPTSTLPHLERRLAERGITVGDVRQILLTHIHLDHAGATGSIVERHPHIDVYVHERGAPHMVDPSKLLASATRLYGADMNRLWGAFVAVPGSRVKVLRGGERMEAGGRELEVAYTPGHASHHVSYFDPSSRIAFVGDTAGIRRQAPSGPAPGGRTIVLPPTPPPDIDLDAWRASADRILRWDPDTLFLTHFGPVHGARPHFQELFERLGDWSRLVRRLLAWPGDDSAREQAFVAEVVRELERTVGNQEAPHYLRAGRPEYSWQGLARYWRKRLDAGT